VKIKTETGCNGSAIYYKITSIGTKQGTEREDIREKIDLQCLFNKEYRQKELHQLKSKHPFRKKSGNYHLHDANYEYIEKHGVHVEFLDGKVVDFHYHTDHDEQVKCLLGFVNRKLIGKAHMDVKRFTEYTKKGTIYVFVFELFQRNKAGAVIASMGKESDKDALKAAQELLNQGFKRVDLVFSHFFGLSKKSR